MRDFIAGITLLACLFVFTVSFIALFKPLPKLKLPTRKSALKGFGVGFALFGELFQGVGAGGFQQAITLEQLRFAGDQQ